MADTVIKMIVERQQVIDVQFTSEAFELHKQFRTYCNHHRNDTTNNAFKNIWNRTHLKANKMAAILAVAHNYHMPVIDALMYRWAVSLVLTDAVNLVSKFERGVIGESENQDNEQIQSMRHAIGGSMMQPPGYYKNWAARLHADYVIPLRFIQSTCAARAAFRKDKKSGAIPRTVKSLVDMGVIAPVPFAQAVEKYGDVTGALYAIKDASWFMSTD